MMRDPEDLLRSLPPESPPPEVVMVAMRVFRYRAFGALALAAAIVLSGFMVKGALDRDARLLERIGGIRYTTGGTININELRDVDGAKVLLWEVVMDEDGTSFVHLLAWDDLGRNLTMSIVGARVDGQPVALGSLEGYGGGVERTHADLWQEISVPTSGEELTFEVEVRSDDEVFGSVPFEIDV